MEHVSGFCAKDCAEPKGDVMIQFGAGKVDFAGVFGVLKSAGFNGPIMVECCAVGDTCLLYTSPSPRDGLLSRMPSSA